MKKLIGILLLVFVAVFCVACGNGKTAKNKYNALLYDYAVEWIKQDFQNENPVRPIGYSDDGTGTALPKSRTFIVNDYNDFEEIFVDDFSEFEVDFDSETVIVYTFSSISALPAKITNIELSDKILTIEFETQTIPNAGTAARPYQRWFVVKLDKLDLLSVNFSEK